MISGSSFFRLLISQVPDFFDSELIQEQVNKFGNTSIS